MANIIANRYELIKQIGSGGMANVYLALDTVLDRTVAIKVLKSDMSSDSVSLERFNREAHASTKLSHPNIVDIYDVGDQGNSHYIVMEYVKGYTLKQLIKKRGAIPPREAVWMMKQLTAALLEAHKNGLIHRDIKSQNVLIKDDGTVKLADFGIAILNNSAQLTSKDSILGSVHYLAPELIKGQAASMQSDIYSLGIVMYEILTGDVPYKGDTPAAIALKHMKNNVPDVRKFNPDIPQSVANIIIKACARDPKERFNNAAEMLKALIDCLKPEHASDQTLILKCSQLEDGKDIADFSKAKISKGEIRRRKQEKKEKRINILLISLISIVSIILLVGGLFITGIIGPKVSKTSKVPDIINLTLAQAKDLLDSEGISINYPYNYEYTKDTKEGLIANVSPEVGSVIDKGSKISITISRGTYQRMNNYIGKNIDDVKKSLIGTSISLDIKYEEDEERQPGEIINQSIPEGQEYNPGDRIELVLTVIQAKTVNIPTDLIGEQLNDVVEKLEDLGINVTSEEMDISELSDAERANYKNYQVVSISPEEGSVFEITDKNEVVITYFYLEGGK